jgi:hypothetical protein
MDKIVPGDGLVLWNCRKKEPLGNNYADVSISCHFQIPKYCRVQANHN